jgi:hypothetical protein
MFNKQFFLKHQGKLLWLLNTPVVCLWFRYVLRISGESSSVGRRRIFRIIPNAIFWLHGDKQVAEFRTHAKFSKRLYYAFAPLWWALHAWDWCVADRWVPELSFGFDTLTKYPYPGDATPNTVDGYVDHAYSLGSGASWATICAAAGTAANDTATSNSCMNIVSDNVSNQWIRVRRGIYLFDTSSITSGATISATVMSLYGVAKDDGLDIAADVDVYASSPGSDTALASGDFDSFGSISQTGSPISYASFSTAGYNDFTFNATGRGNVSKTGISKFGTRNANYDVAGSPPAWANDTEIYIDAYFADQTGTANDPKLVVTYSTYTEDVPYVIAYVTRTDLFAGSSRT